MVKVKPSLLDIEKAQSATGQVVGLCDLYGLANKYLTRPQLGVSYLSASEREGLPSANSLLDHWTELF